MMLHITKPQLPSLQKTFLWGCTARGESWDTFRHASQAQS